MKFLDKTAFSPVSVYQGAQFSSGALISNRRHVMGLSIAAWLRTAFKPLRLWIRSITGPFRLSPAPAVTLSADTMRIHANPDSYPERNTSVKLGGDKIAWIKANHLLQLQLQLYPYPTTHHPETNCSSLAGQFILCVGGRAALYPDYHRLVESAGGNLMVFRGGALSNTHCLLTMLECVNMIICPVDCINHEDFFTVKRYCQRTGKYCVILERSNLATFSKAVAILARNHRFHAEASSPQANLPHPETCDNAELSRPD